MPGRKGEPKPRRTASRRGEATVDQDFVKALAHRKVDHSADEWVRGIVHTNTIESIWNLFKRSVVGTYHQMSAKHLLAYLDGMGFASTIATTPSCSPTRYFG
jgi:hypothetical protein